VGYLTRLKELESVLTRDTVSLDAIGSTQLELAGGINTEEVVGATYPSPQKGSNPGVTNNSITNLTNLRISTAAPEPENSKKGYELVTSVDLCREVVSALSQEPLSGLDIETIATNRPGKGPIDYYQDRVRLVQVATPSGCWVFDIASVPLEDLTPYFTSPGLKVIHNASFECAFVKRCLGVTLSPVFDTMLADQVLRTDLRDRHGLKDLVQYYLGEDLSKEEQLSDWSGELTPEQLAYAARDSQVLLLLYDKLLAEASKAGVLPILELEHRALPSVVSMTLDGLGIDWDKWVALCEARRSEMERLSETLAGKVPGTVNWMSSQQVVPALNSLGVTVENCQKKTLSRHRDAHPVMPQVISYRECKSLLSKYNEKWEKHINPVTGRIHGSFHQLGARTGRFSVSNPPLQGLPREGGYRDCIVLREGHRLLVADWSQVEVRIAAEMSSDKAMQNIFLRGQDIHREVARKLLNLPANATVPNEARQLAKAVVFGLIYGMRPKSLVVYARDNYKVTMTLPEAVRFVDLFFQMFPDLRRWQKQEQSRLERERRVETRTVLGRRRWVDLDRDGHTAWNQILNTPVQGSGADALKLAVALLEEEQESLPGASLVLVVHDEIVLEVPGNQVAEGKEFLASIMNRALVEAALRVVPPGIAAGDIADSDHWIKP
jgi:DNA polymerase-1